MSNYQHGDVVTEIVVNGERYPTSVWWDGSLIYEDCEAWVNFVYWYETEGGGGSTPPFQSNYPVGFDKAADKRVDLLAKQLAQQIFSKPDVFRKEYGAIIWRDSAGNFHATTIRAGTDRSIDLTPLFSQIDFAGGGKIVAVMHSHPVEYNMGTEENPNWGANPNAMHLANADFNGLMSAYNGLTGYDSPLYREYLVYNGNVREFYGFDQNPPENVDPSAPATYAIASSDYDSNVAP